MAANRSTDERLPPSGRQWEIRHGEQRVVIVEVGGGLREYSCGARAILDGYPEDEMCNGARGQTLIPWPNRLEDGRYEANGVSLQLPLTEPEKHNAIHGLVRWSNFVLEEQETNRLVVSHTLHAQMGWPFVLSLQIEYLLTEAGLVVGTTATNRGAANCPYAAGVHPYLTIGSETIDDAWLQVPASSYLPTDARQLPLPRQSVADGPLDFRRRRRIGATHIDYAFTDLARDSDGLARLVMSSADGSRAVALWVDEHYRWLEVFTGDTLKRPDKRRTGLGVEPMTCPPNGLRSGTDVIALAPAESVTTRWGITPQR